MIKAYGLNSSRSTRMLWALEEAQVEYTYHHLNFRQGEHLSKEYLSINPASKVPSLVDGELVLTESAAIVNYIANKYAPHLAPASVEEKALYDQWLFFITGELEQALWTIGKNKFALPKERRVADAIELGKWEQTRSLDLLSKGLGDKDYLLGDKFTAVDIMAGHTLAWGLRFKLPLEQDNLQKYYNRITERDGYKKALEKEKTFSFE